MFKIFLSVRRFYSIRALSVLGFAAVCIFLGCSRNPANPYERLEDESSVLTLELAVNASGKLGIYAWVTDISNNYINTIVSYSRYGSYLNDDPVEWESDVGGKAVDGISQATISSSYYSVDWDLHSYLNQKVPDGDYIVKINLTQHSSEGRHFYSNVITLGSESRSASIAGADSWLSGNIEYIVNNN